MRLGELLIGQGLVTPEVVAEALKRQRLEGAGSATISWRWEL